MTTSPLDSHAEKVLAALRGYMYRTPWMPEDRQVITSILQQWQDEVIGMEQVVAARDREIARLQQDLKDFKFATYGCRPSEFSHSQ